MIISTRFIAVSRRAFPFALFLAATTTAFAASIGGPMLLQDEGMFFVNGEAATTNFPSVPAAGAPVPGTIVTKQMYVHYRIPYTPFKKPGTYPIVLVHGGGLTGMSYETTPDGREGWATYFTRKGFPTYVVDFPGRGRAGFDPTSINQAKYESNPALLPSSINRTTAEAAWTTFRFGPTYGTPYPGTQYPVAAMEAFGAQGVPGTDVTLSGGALVNNPIALSALLDKIGPAIVVVHSQSGPNADALVGMRPNLVKGVINVEGSQNGPVPTAAQIAAYRNVPDLELFGDNVQGNPASTGQARYNARLAVVNSINAAGGKAAIVQLPEVGLHGNTHMLMQDKNNLQVADFLVQWINQNVK